MKVVINASTVRIGGGLQATHSFLSECRVLSGNTFHVPLLTCGAGTSSRIVAPVLND